MKKTLSLILAFVLCLSLCSCGLGRSKTLLTYETINDGNIELTVVGSNFCVRGPLAIEPLDDDSDSGSDEVYCTVYVGVNNIGTTDYAIPSSVIGKLTYNNDYEYQANLCSELSECNWLGSNLSLSSASSLNENLVTLPALSQAKLLAIIFVVPREIMENTNNPATVSFRLDKKNYSYDLRTSADILSGTPQSGELASNVIKQYQEAWLIRNISNCMELLYDDISFVWTYAGNVNRNNQHKFSDEILNRITTAFDSVHKKIDSETIGQALPVTATKLKTLQSDCKSLVNSLNKLGSTNNAKYVDEVKDTAWDIMMSIKDAASTDEFTKHGRFASFN